MIDSIEVPPQFVDVASRWYSGMDRLYSVASVGTLRRGNRCPVYDFTDHADRDAKWYYSLWCDLSSDIESARRACRTILAGCQYSDDYDEWVTDSILLQEFAEFVDNVTATLEAEYPQLIDWSGE